jgi:morphogenetic protein associated with SpoVID
MDNNMPMMPQVGGMMENNMPKMPQVGGMMDNQMPQVGGAMQPPMMPKQGVQGMGYDCGCGGGPMGGPYGVMGAGLPPQFHHGYPGAPGMQPYPQHGFPMGMGPHGMMNPYAQGPMGGGYGMPMPRFDEESNEY